MVGPDTRAWFRALAERMLGSIARALVTRVLDTAKAQELQLAVLDGETLDGVERLQCYGLTSVPLAPSADGTGPEAVVLFLDGSRAHGVVVAVEDRRYRLTGLAGGEVALYDDQGQRLHLLRAKVVLRTKAGQVIELTDAAAALGAADGVVHGTGVDPATGLTYFALGNASAVVRAKK